MKRLKWIGLLTGLGLFLWILKNSDLTAVWQQIRLFHWRFGLIFLVYAVVFGLDTLGWRFALAFPSRARVNWGNLFRTRLAGEALNYVTPTVSVGGEPIKAVLLLKRYGIPMSEGMASVVVAKTTFAFSMLLFAGVGLVLALILKPLEPQLLKWVWIVLPALVILMVLFLIAQFLQPFSKFRPAWLGWDEAITHFYRKFPSAVVGSLLFHFLGWVVGVVEVYLILQFLGVPVSFLKAWTIEALWVLLRSGAFMIPASLGASEGFLLLICAGFGISAVSGLALGLIRRARELLWMGWGLVEFSRQ